MRAWPRPLLLLAFGAAIAVAPTPSLARGAGGGAHGGGGGGGGHAAGGHAGGHLAGGNAARYRDGYRGRGGTYFGGRFGSHLYVGPSSTWTLCPYPNTAATVDLAGQGRCGPHWGSSFWVWTGDAWVAHPGRYYVSPDYPGWVWMGNPWVWDGHRWDGYWTTADMPRGQAQEPGPDWPPPPPSDD
jgi:hypothetical protein